MLTNPVLRIYWFIFRPRTKGVKCLILHNDKFLLVKLSYGKQHWTFPGGGVEKGETPEEAVRREVQEEVDIYLKDLTFLGFYKSRHYHRRDTVYCFLARLKNENFKIDNSEIQDAEWFQEGDFPNPLSFAVNDVLRLYRSKF